MTNFVGGKKSSEMMSVGGLSSVLSSYLQTAATYFCPMCGSRLAMTTELQLSPSLKTLFEMIYFPPANTSHLLHQPSLPVIPGVRDARGSLYRESFPGCQS